MSSKPSPPQRKSKSPEGARGTEALPLPSGPNVDQQPALAAADSGDVEDGEFEPEDFDGVSTSSTSINSSVLEHEYENGRRYHHYRHGRYPLPNDDAEQGRDHMKHVIHLESCDGELLNAPIGDHPQKILDLCTGTGLWAIDMADRFPSAEIIGLDLSPIQPSWVPPNVRFMIDDVEDDWVDAPDEYDLIHMRHSCAYIKDVDRLLSNSHERLKPGGWLELSDFGGYALCDDGTMPENYPVNECFALIGRMLAERGCNRFVANEHAGNLQRAGFRNVQCRIVKIPIGIWPRDKTKRLIGLYYREVLAEMINGLAARAFKNMGVTEEELQVFLMSVRKSLHDTSVHSYFNFIVWWGQK